MPNIGPMEIAIVLIIALVIFGPKKLPELGKSVGTGFKEFKDGVSGKSLGLDDDKPTSKPAVTATATPEPTTTTTESAAASEPAAPIAKTETA